MIPGAVCNSATSCQQTRTSYVYDGYGNQQSEYDYGQTSTLQNGSFENGLTNWTPFSGVQAAVTQTVHLLGIQSLAMNGGTSGGVYQD